MSKSIDDGWILFTFSIIQKERENENACGAGNPSGLETELEKRSREIMLFSAGNPRSLWIPLEI